MAICLDGHVAISLSSLWGNKFRLGLRAKYGARALPWGQFPMALNRELFVKLFAQLLIIIMFSRRVGRQYLQTLTAGILSYHLIGLAG